MQIQIEDVSPVEKKLIVEIPWEIVNTKLGAAYRELSRTARLRGFRQGKVPVSVIKQMFGKRVRAEVTEELVQASFAAAIKEHDVKAVSKPRIGAVPEIKNGKPLAFEYIVEVKGTVSAVEHAGMTLRCHRTDVIDADLEAAFERLRQEHAELLPIEGREVTAPTDVLTIAVRGTIGEVAVDRPRMNVDLGEPSREPLPGLAAALTGIRLDAADHEIAIDVPEDYSDAQLAGQTARLAITVTDARQKQLPDLDDEFAVDTGRAETLDGLREELRVEIEKRRAETRVKELREAAKRVLVEMNQIPVAAGLVEHAVTMQVQRLEQMFGMKPGESADMFDRSRFRDSALEELRAELLLEALAEIEEIEVSAEALDEQIQQIATERDKPVQRVRAELERDGELESLRYGLRQDAVLDWLVERAEVVEWEHSADDADHDHDDHDDHQHADGAAEPAAEGDRVAEPAEGAETDAAEAPAEASAEPAPEEA